MADKPTGGPAFPYSALTPEGPNMYGDAQGMTLRDWFAGQALIGETLRRGDDIEWVCLIAESCYKIADAMIAERQ